MSLFSSLRRLMYVYGSPPLDNFVFKLCYRWTTLLLLVFCFIITCRLLFGDSFDCISSMIGGSITIRYINSKCYDNVYVKLSDMILKKNSTAVVDPSLEDLKRYQTYYPWVNLLFLLQAFLFYLPHLLWMSYEKGYVYRLTAGVQKSKSEKRGSELCYLAKYFLVTQGRHKLYTAMYSFFEMCNFAIALAQCLWLVKFFDITGVPSLFPYALDTWSEFKDFYFPSDGMCILHRKGPSGAMQRFDAMCQMPLNTLYMKMYLFLYGWYVLLTVLCAMVIVYRIALLLPSFRMSAVKASSPLSDKLTLMSVCSRLPYSDWFFLSMLQKSMNGVDFAQMVDKISVASQAKDKDKEDNVKFSFCNDATKDPESATSPL